MRSPLALVRRAYGAIRDRLVEPQMMQHFEGRTTAQVPIEFSLRAEQVRLQCLDTVSWDAPVDEDGNIIVGDYSAERDPMDGVEQMPYDRVHKTDVNPDEVDRVFQVAQLDPSLLLGPRQKEQQ